MTNITADSAGRLPQAGDERHTPRTRKRRAISKTLRFEVFKRDAFTCQYCGGKAPEVVLHVDHIEPHAKGGSDEMVNLITACAACNGGKGARRLSDHSTLAKQRKQLDILAERREQLEMMAAWRAELSGLREREIDAVSDTLDQWCGYEFTDTARRQIGAYIRRYGFDETLKSAEIAFRQYIKPDDSANKIQRSITYALNKIAGIAITRSRPGFSPHEIDARYVGGIIRNRFGEQEDAVPLALSALQAGIDPVSLKRFAKSAGSWDAFEDRVNFCLAFGDPL